MKKSVKYDTSGLIEAQFEPGSHGRVLKNRLGIKGRKEMDEAESVALAVATDKILRMYDADRRFTAEDITTMHKTWLGGIYGGKGMGGWQEHFLQSWHLRQGCRFSTLRILPVRNERNILRQSTTV